MQLEPEQRLTPKDQYTIPDHDSGIIEDVPAVVAGAQESNTVYDIFAQFDKNEAAAAPRPECIAIMTYIEPAIEQLRNTA